VIATHSPILLTFPDADIVSFDERPLRSVRLEDTGDPRGSSAVLAGTAEG